MSSDLHVRRCLECLRLGSERDAHRSALAAGLDVQQSGFVAGVSGAGADVPQPDLSDLARVCSGLAEILDQLQQLPRRATIPAAVGASLDQLVLEVARVQGVCEWLDQGLVRLVEEEEGED